MSRHRFAFVSAALTGVLAWGCGGPPAAAPAPQAPRLAEHFSRAAGLYTAVADGRLDVVRALAQTSLEQETGADLPARSAEYAAQLRAFVALAARAPDLDAAGSAVARAGASCGACHAALRRGPRATPVGPPPPDERGVTAHMLRHRWATDRLWEGLSSPSEAAWAAGAAVLRDAPLYTDALTADFAQYEGVTRLAWTVHELGARAGAVHDRNQRAELYGQLIATCARCHGLIRQAR